jgi:hypothetical protein
MRSFVPDTRQFDDACELRDAPEDGALVDQPPPCVVRAECAVSLRKGKMGSEFIRRILEADDAMDDAYLVPLERYERNARPRQYVFRRVDSTHVHGTEKLSR